MKARRLLVVDDEPGIRQSLGGVLEDEGYEVSAVDSGEACLAAFRASDDIGVDMEWVRELQDCEDIAARWFPPAERRAFFGARANERPRRFLLCWTRVEARAKADGSGLGGIFAGADRSRTWRVRDVGAPGNYVATLAFRHPPARLARHCVRPASCCFESAAR